MEFIKKLISTIALLMIIPAFGEAKKESNDKSKISFYIVYTICCGGYISPRKIYQTKKHSKTVLDVYHYATRRTMEELFSIKIAARKIQNNKNYTDNIDVIAISGNSAGLAYALFVALKEKTQSQKKVEHVFATGSFFPYGIIYKKNQEKLDHYTSWEECYKKGSINLPKISKENLQFYEAGKIDTKLATIIKYALDEELENVAIFLPKKHECDIQKWINDIDSYLNNVENTKEQKKNILEDVIKLKIIIQKINTVDTYKDIEKLSLEDIKTFSHMDCPPIDTSMFYTHNSPESLQYFLESIKGK